MNVYDNMAFEPKLRKTPRKEIEKRVQDVVRILKIEELLKRKAKQFLADRGRGLPWAGR
jgi:ABC-type sugar transport system ATPase subunit